MKENIDFTNPELYQLRLLVRKFKEKHSLNLIKPFGVGFSGGADSLALLVALKAENFNIVPLIIDHQLQKNSDKYAIQAKENAEKIGISSSKIITVEVGETGGMEAAAREARYAAFSKEKELEAIFLGHTMNDQAETVLMGLARGAGISSIKGMSEKNGRYLRPFLEVKREQTKNVCKVLGLEYVNDPQNQDLKFTRVKLRKEVIPLLEKTLQGGVVESLAKTAKWLQQDNIAIDALVEKEYQNAVLENEVDIVKIQELTTAIRIRIVKKWLNKNKILFLNKIQLEAIDALTVKWKGQGSVAIVSNCKDASSKRLVVKRVKTRLKIDKE